MLDEFTLELFLVDVELPCGVKVLELQKNYEHASAGPLRAAQRRSIAKLTCLKSSSQCFNLLISVFVQDRNRSMGGPRCPQAHLG